MSTVLKRLCHEMDQTVLTCCSYAMHAYLNKGSERFQAFSDILPILEKIFKHLNMQQLMIICPSSLVTVNLKCSIHCKQFKISVFFD